MAVLFRKAAIVGCVDLCNHFMHWVGKLLSPVLLFALKCKSSTCSISAAVTLAIARSSGYVNVSLGRLSS